MTPEEHEARLQALQVDIDTRLADVWAMAWGEASPLATVMADEAQRDAFAACFRVAYARGYRDAHREFAAGKAGELATANGYTAT